ncbi:hypothetical protein [Rathayibacter sp. AY1F3]|uniref:hypothetical protein n=1 Tax=Rathayibacter sp. AY1F3 TaxID=2080558 RepID=UPI0015E37F7C|nr:hypothetical protein [Rathayibacter sp. AY1F3]
MKVTRSTRAGFLFSILFDGSAASALKVVELVTIMGDLQLKVNDAVADLGRQSM